MRSGFVQHQIKSNEARRSSNPAKRGAVETKPVEYFGLAIRTGVQSSHLHKNNPTGGLFGFWEREE